MHVRVPGGYLNFYGCAARPGIVYGMRKWVLSAMSFRSFQACRVGNFEALMKRGFVLEAL